MLVYLVETGAIPLGKLRTISAVVVGVKGGEGQPVVAKKGIASVAQVHGLEIEPIEVALRAYAEALVTSETLVPAPVFQIDGELVLFPVVGVGQSPEQDIAYRAEQH